MPQGPGASAKKSGECTIPGEQIAAIIENSSDAVIACSAEGVATCFNRAAENLLSWKREEVLGNSLLGGGFLPAHVVEAWLAEARLVALSGENPEKTGEQKVSFADGAGREQVYNVRIQPLRDKEGRFAGFAALMACSERVQTQYATHLMHEMRTPLTTILASSHIIRGKCLELLPPQALKQLETIGRNARSLLEITNDFLDLSRLRHGAYSVIAQNVDLADLLGEVRDEVEPLYHRKGLTLDTTIEDGTPERVLVDPEALRRILVNLLSNACKFTEKGGATLKVSAGGDQLRWAIRDTGVGLPAQEIKALFREFSQLGDSETLRRGGSGLGLVIADRFARLLGGRIEVESRPGEGSCFTVVVPFSPSADEP